jgi:hypothetical protein
MTIFRFKSTLQSTPLKKGLAGLFCIKNIRK